MTKTDSLVCFTIAHGKQRSHGTKTMTPESWSYRLTPEALIEEIVGRTRVYGRWDWQFGCWDVNFEGNTLKEVVIDWPVLDRRGVWLEPSDIRGPAGCPTHASWYFEARAAYAAYFSLIPTPIRLLATPRRTLQWRQLCRMSPVYYSELRCLPTVKPG